MHSPPTVAEIESLGFKHSFIRKYNDVPEKMEYYYVRSNNGITSFMIIDKSFFARIWGTNKDGKSVRYEDRIMNIDYLKKILKDLNL